MWRMEAVEFQHAFPPTVLGDELLVPLHIVGVEATMSMAAATRRAFVDATMTYVVGPTDGNPVFDLRQDIDGCWVDGIAVHPDTVAAREVGEPGAHSSLRVLGRHQRAGSPHTLRVCYTMSAPDSDLGGAYPPMLQWFPGSRVRWSVGMADLFAGRYLEAWFPSNLPFDHFPFALDLAITGSEVAHTVITNGAVTTTGVNHWLIRFPAWFTSMSALIEVHATHTLRMAETTMRLPRSGRAITLRAYKCVDGSENLSDELRRTADLIAEHERLFGHFTGDSFVCFFHGSTGGMEYAHATTTSSAALTHEVIHSWFGRGITPASPADGWWDEGFTHYLARGQGPEALDLTAPPVALGTGGPFRRTTSPDSYGAGSRVFRGIAAMVGPERLLAAMRELYSACCGTSLSTEDLERHLVSATGAGSITDVFARFVYGRGSAAEGRGRAPDCELTRT